MSVVCHINSQISWHDDDAHCTQTAAIIIEFSTAVFKCRGNATFVCTYHATFTLQHTMSWEGVIAKSQRCLKSSFLTLKYVNIHYHHILGAFGRKKYEIRTKNGQKPCNLWFGTQQKEGKKSACQFAFSVKWRPHTAILVRLIAIIWKPLKQAFIWCAACLCWI